MVLQKVSAGVLDQQIKALGSSKKAVSFEDAKALIRKNFSIIFPGDKPATAQDWLLTEQEAQRIQKAFNRQFPQGKYTNKVKGQSALANEIINCFNNKCSLSYTTGGHTSMPVLTTAYGQCGWMFNGFIDNTDIAKLLKQVVR